MHTDEVAIRMENLIIELRKKKIGPLFNSVQAELSFFFYLVVIEFETICGAGGADLVWKSSQLFVSISYKL